LRSWFSYSFNAYLPADLPAIAVTSLVSAAQVKALLNPTGIYNVALIGDGRTIVRSQE